MKSVFLCNDKYVFSTVYSENMIDTLKKETEVDGTVYTYENIKNEDLVFTDTEYIFSTWGMPILTEGEIKKHFPTLKCLFYSAGTVQDFARPFLNLGIKVFSGWAGNAVPVAEYTVAQIILANKGFFSSVRTIKLDGYAKARADFEDAYGNFGANVGIIGAGMIGKLVINLLKAYRLNVFVFDPFLSDEAASEMGVKKVSLKELFENCSVISNHLANNEQTKGMLDYSCFSLVKENATFINTGRGAQVVEDDLITALKERPDFTAILDVTDPEPPLQSSELYTLENCILTPHIAGSCCRERERLVEFMLDEFRHFKAGEKTKYEVTLKMLETMA